MKLYVLDGNSLLFRAYYATAFRGDIMRTKKGFPTNAIFGFSNMISKLVSSLKKDDYIMVAFDTGKKTFRHEQLDTYKAQRKPIDEDLKVQLPLARDYLKAMGIFFYELDGYEGDDIAGSVAKQFGSKNNIETHIYTSDKDYLQLIDDNISIEMIKKGLSDIETMNEESLKEKMGLTPSQIRDFKGLMGDPSDNLPGIPGIGEKSAIKLIQQYGSLEEIIKGMENQTSKQAQKILENQESGKICKEMATIITDISLPFTISDLKYEGYDFNELSSFFTKYEFFSSLKKLKPTDKRIIKEETNNDDDFNIITVSKFKDIPPCSTIIIDQEGGNYNFAPINAFCFPYSSSVYVLPFVNAKKDKDFKEFIEDENILKDTYDFKALKVSLSRYGFDVKGVGFDLTLATNLLRSSVETSPVSVYAFYEVNILKQNNFSLLQNDDMFANMAYHLAKLKPQIIERLKEEDSYELFTSIELPLCNVLAKMEINGFPLNKKVLSDLNDEYVKKLNDITSSIYDIVGHEFNIASPKQLANVLFDELGLPRNKKESTSIEILNELKNRHEVIPLIIEYRKYSKIISTYSQGLLNFVNDDGKIHTIYNQALTSTGRLSSSEPNLQNISVKSEEGKAVRKAFFYDDDNYEILSLDYSQIELRILASLSKCQKLIDTFNNDGDIHSQTAMDVFNVTKEEVTPSLRRRAKAVNFGIIYGISDWGLSEQISSSPSEAKKIITTFYEKYPEIKEYFTNVINFASQNGYITTLYKRRRYINELKSSNYMTREFGKRAAMNAPIQGSAADLIKIAMIKVDEMLSSSSYKTQMVLQIHDELIFKVPKDEKEIILPKIKDIMENATTLDVKLKVDGDFGRTWFDCK